MTIHRGQALLDSILPIIAVIAFVLVADGIWLRVMKPMYSRTIRRTQKKEFKRVRMGGAAAAYVCIIVLIVLFAELTSLKPWEAALYGFVYGAAVYGVFNGTNVAIFEDYSTKTAIIDTIWGGVLFASAIFLYGQV